MLPEEEGFYPKGERYFLKIPDLLNRR